MTNYKFNSPVAKEASEYFTFMRGFNPIVLDWIIGSPGSAGVYMIYSGLDILRKTGVPNQDIKQWSANLIEQNHALADDNGNPKTRKEVADEVAIEMQAMFSVMHWICYDMMMAYVTMPISLKEQVAGPFASYLSYMKDRVGYRLSILPMLKHLNKESK